MMRLTELKKIAKQSGFVEQMRDVGFTLGPDSFWFYRERGDFIDLFTFWIKSSGNWFEVPLYCLHKAHVEHCDMSLFPKGFMKGIPNLFDKTVQTRDLDKGKNWEMQDEQQAINTLNDLANVFKKKAEPWFSAIDTNQKLHDSYSLRFQGSERAIRLSGIDNNGKA
ncbi:hypothetical protein ISG33_11070 [Glaciecola sp. MH2013]|uniref:hypothetical protein n=1 Tax=Glaciecola sp. MH2013 TaxID=2785524 RepID=UPI0018A0C15C|nr:hypothetical protein [Glaciecola sp. MH2013]MBF7073941.1 hypothetical protein [Glaciecola sp. MH2013]